MKLSRSLRGEFINQGVGHHLGQHNNGFQNGTDYEDSLILFCPGNVITKSISDQTQQATSQKYVFLHIYFCFVKSVQ